MKTHTLSINKTGNVSKKVGIRRTNNSFPSLSEKTECHKTRGLKYL